MGIKSKLPRIFRNQMDILKHPATRSGTFALQKWHSHRARSPCQSCGMQPVAHWLKPQKTLIFAWPNPLL